MSAPGTRIIGIGNPLMGDDGIGIAAIKLLEKANLPEDIELIDGGCAGVTLLQLLEDCQLAIIIDAADFSAQPGTIHILHNPDPAQLFQEHTGQLSHQPGLQEVLLLADKLGRLPQVTLVLVQVESCQQRLQLSPSVQSALPKLVRRIFREILHLGISGSDRIHSQH